MADSVAFGKDSIQIPYRRFLADSAAGFAFIGLVVLGYYAGFFGPWHLNVSTEPKVFLLVLLFLLATPIGFTANAVSWLLLGNAVASVERLCFRFSNSASPVFVTWHISQARRTAKLADYFKIDADTFSTTGSLFRDLMESDALAKFAPPSNARELMIFLRNIALYLLTGAGSVVVFSNRAISPASAGAVALLLVLVLILRQPAYKQPWWKLPRLLIPSIRFVAALGAGLLCWSSSEGMTAILLLAGTIVVVLVAGMVDYYHYSYVLLHAYFACRALGVQWPDPSLTPDRDMALLNAGTGLYSAAAQIEGGARKLPAPAKFCAECGKPRA